MIEALLSGRFSKRLALLYLGTHQSLLTPVQNGPIKYLPGLKH